MKVVKVEVTFSKEELENQSIYNSEYDDAIGCEHINCDDVECTTCPLYELTKAERMKYIKKHVEGEEVKQNV